MVAEMQSINARSAGEKCKGLMVLPVAKQASLLTKARTGKHIDYLDFFTGYFESGYLQ